MSCITKHFFIILVPLFCNFSFCNEPEDLKYISVLDKPSFSINSPDRQVTLTGEWSRSLNGSEFIIQIPNLKLNSNKFPFFIYTSNLNYEFRVSISVISPIRYP